MIVQRVSANSRTNKDEAKRKEKMLQPVQPSGFL